MVKGIRTLEFGMAPAAMAACNASGTPAIARGSSLQGDNDIERCEYPDMLRGAWNETLTFRCPTIITLPHFFKACLLHLSREHACIIHQHLVNLEGKLATACHLLAAHACLCRDHFAGAHKQHAGGRQTLLSHPAQAQISRSTQRSTTRFLVSSPRRASHFGHAPPSAGAGFNCRQGRRMRTCRMCAEETNPTPYTH